MIRVRYAPSPTGDIHIGTIRTYLLAHTMAKQAKGYIFLRIEDTDIKRSTEESTQGIYKMLKAYGLDYDEGPEKPGRNGPYIQTQRKDIYKKYALELVKKGSAYYCFCSKDRLKKLREKQTQNKQKPRYDNRCRNLSKDEIKNNIKKGIPYVIRFKVPDNEKIIGYDEIIGKIEFNSNELDDFIMLKSDNLPTYHLAVVIDDHLWGITHVHRGVEWLSSYPKHILIYKAFGWEMPKFIHLPVLLDPNGGKLSKRRGSVSAKDFLRNGYLVEATLNFLMLLGWAPKDGREMISRDEFIKEFDIKKLGAASPIFDRNKLLWLNSKYIKKMTISELKEKFLAWLSEWSDTEESIKNNLTKYIKENGKSFKILLSLVQPRVRLLSEIITMLKFMISEIKPNYDFINIKGLNQYEIGTIKNAVTMLTKFIQYLGDTTNWQHNSWETGIRKIGDELNMKHADVFMLLRIIITGSQISPPLFEVMALMKTETIISRLNNYLAGLK